MEKDIVRKINDLVGAPFSFIQRFKMNGIGSSRMIIDETVYFISFLSIVWKYNIQLYISMSDNINICFFIVFYYSWRINR